MSKLDFMEALFPSHGLAAPPFETRFWPTLFGGGMMSSAGVQVTAESAMRQATANACVRVLSETLAQLPVNVFERTGSGQRIQADSYTLSNVIGGIPNRWQTWFEWCEMMEGHLALRGNAYSLIVPGEWGAVTELWPLHPERVSVTRLENMRLLYTVTYPSGKQQDFNQDEIFHVRGLSSDGMVGLSPIAMARDTLGLSIAAEGYGSKFFAGGVRPSGILKLPPGTKPQDAEKAQQTLIQKYSGPDGWNIPMALWGSIEWQELGMTNKDAEFLESMKRSDVEICKIWRMPPHMVGILDRSTNNNIEQQSLEFVLYTMLPWVRRWEEAIARQLIADPDRYYVKFNLRGLLRGDAATRATFYTQMVNAGLMCPNEVRELEDLDPYDGGDNFFMQGAMVPVDRLLNPPEPPPPVRPPQGPTQDEHQQMAIQLAMSQAQVEIHKAHGQVLATRLAACDQRVAEADEHAKAAQLAADQAREDFARAQATATEAEDVIREREKQIAELDAKARACDDALDAHRQEQFALQDALKAMESTLAMAANAADDWKRRAEGAERVVALARQSNAALIMEVLDRIGGIECEYTRKASRLKGNVCESVDKYYDSHGARLMSAMDLAWKQRLRIVPDCPVLQTHVTAYITKSKTIALECALLDNPDRTKAFESYAEIIPARMAALAVELLGTDIQEGEEDAATN